MAGVAILALATAAVLWHQPISRVAAAVGSSNDQEFYSRSGQSASGDATLASSSAISTPSPLPRFTPDFNFPRLFDYSRISSAGYPWTQALVQQAGAKKQVNVMSVEPIQFDHPEIITNMRAQNRSQVDLAYFLVDQVWNNTYRQDFGTGYFFGDVQEAVKTNNWYIHDQSGTGLQNWHGPFGEWQYDFSNPAFVSWYVNYIATSIHDQHTSLWDGIFMDNFCDRMGWEDAIHWDSNGNPIPYTVNNVTTYAMNMIQNGKNYNSYIGQTYTTTNGQTVTINNPRDAMGYVYQDDRAAGMTNFVRALRARVGDQYVLVGNCGFGSQFDTLNGSLTENFPQFQLYSDSFGQWSNNVFQPSGGYVVHDLQTQAPTYNMLDVPLDTSAESYNSTTDTCLNSDLNQYKNAYNLKTMRYGLTTALLGNGFYAPDDLTDTTVGKCWDAWRWWYDEFDGGTNPATGQPYGVGYLGLPTTIPYQLVDTTKLSGSDLWTNGDVEVSTLSTLDPNGGWTISSGIAGNSWALDATTAGSGAKSLHGSVINQPPDDFNMKVLRTFSAVGAGYYSETFWAKSAQPRPYHIRVDGYQVSGGAYKSYADETLQLDATWRQYQVSFHIPATANVTVNIGFGQTVGDVWLDGLSFRAGTGNVWTREFEHGQSFLYPCPASDIYPCPASLTFNLPAPMQHLLGTVNPTLNDGTTVTSITVPTHDGVILLSTTNPPASVAQCTEHWTCTEWSACANGVQTRTCTDDSACRTTATKPLEQQSCLDTIAPAAVHDLRSL